MLLREAWQKEAALGNWGPTRTWRPRRQQGAGRRPHEASRYGSSLPPVESGRALFRYSAGRPHAGLAKWTQSAPPPPHAVPPRPGPRRAARDAGPRVVGLGVR